jgi:GT2 family glycosyltransferase
MNFSPAISAILPVYNGKAYLQEAVESILAQTFTDFELIIINDGSTDGSGALLRELAAHDQRIVLVERANGGLVSALNEGIERAHSGIIARMDADDVAMPQRFALQFAQMGREPDLGVLGSFINIIDKEGHIIRLADYPVTSTETARFLEHGCPVAHPSVMIRRDAVLKAGGYRKAFSHCEDYDLWLRISELGYGIANLPKVLLNYRMHGANVSTIHREAQELGSLIARLAHRMRKAGLTDPVKGEEKVHAGLIQSVPVQLRQDIDAALFVLHHSRLSLGDREDLDATWHEYCKLSPQIQRETIMCGLLMRLLNGAVCKHTYMLALQVFAEAVRLHPRETRSLLWRKTRASFLSTR